MLFLYNVNIDCVICIARFINLLSYWDNVISKFFITLFSPKKKKKSLSPIFLKVIRFRMLKELRLKSLIDGGYLRYYDSSLLLVKIYSIILLQIQYTWNLNHTCNTSKILNMYKYHISLGLAYTLKYRINPFIKNKV